MMIRSVGGIDTGSGVRRKVSDEFGWSVGSIEDLGLVGGSDEFGRSVGSIEDLG